MRLTQSQQSLSASTQYAQNQLKQRSTHKNQSKLLFNSHNCRPPSNFGNSSESSFLQQSANNATVLSGQNGSYNPLMIQSLTSLVGGDQLHLLQQSRGSQDSGVNASQDLKVNSLRSNSGFGQQKHRKGSFLATGNVQIEKLGIPRPELIRSTDSFK